MGTTEEVFMHGGPTKIDSKVVFQTGILRGAWRHFLHLPCMLPNDNTARGIDTPRTTVCYPAHPILKIVAWRIPSTSRCSTRTVVHLTRCTCTNDNLPFTMIIIWARAKWLQKFPFSCRRTVRNIAFRCVRTWLCTCFTTIEYNLNCSLCNMSQKLVSFYTIHSSWNNDQEVH